MADYWKSQDKKYCEFCKCWIADNKPSIGFHEGGKRHKENVARKLKELTKKSTKDLKDKAKLEDDMKKMEEAALKAYMNDIQVNPDYTSHKIKEKLLERDIKLPEPKKSPERLPPPSSRKVWYETQSEQKYTYYWNIETNESVWEPPPEGYVTMAKQIKEAEVQQRLTEAKAVEKSEELRSWQAREAMKKFNKKPDGENVVPSPPKKKTVGEVVEKECSQILGPAPRRDPYGTWTTVEKREEPKVDLQLPETKKMEIYVPVVSEPRIKIKEKTITSLCDEVFNEVNIKQEEGTFFKKRKTNHKRGNIRRRISDDE